MRSVAILLCLTLVGMNAEAALLHVHKGVADTDHHHFRPEAHAHKIHIESTPVDSEVSASDDDSSAVPVVLGKATASQVFYALGLSPNLRNIEPPSSSRVPQFVVTSRAHGPPAGRSLSLRAPPTTFL